MSSPRTQHNVQARAHCIVHTVHGFICCLFLYTGALTAPRQSKGQRSIDLSTTVRRNLNETQFYQHVSQAQDRTSNVYNQGAYDSLNALEAFASQNGFNFNASVLGQASQQLAALNEKQRNSQPYDRTSVQQHEGQMGRTRTSSDSKKRRKSSRGKSEPDIENEPVQHSSTQLHHPEIVEHDNVFNVTPSEKSSQQRPSRSNRKSVEEKNDTNVDDRAYAQNLAPMSAMDLNLTKQNHSHVLPNRTEGLISPNGDQRRDHPPCISPTVKLSPALKGIQLYVPKLVITKVKQRRGSKEVETHQVREVLPESESDLQKTKKRRRSSDENYRNSTSHDWEEGIVCY